MDIFSIPEIITNILKWIDITDVIPVSRTNKQFYQVSDKSWINLQQYRLSAIKNLYKINTTPEMLTKYSQKIEVGRDYIDTILNDFIPYETLPLPGEYIILLKMLKYHKIPTINIVDYKSIKESWDQSLSGSPNVIPLFYLLDVLPCLHGVKYIEPFLILDSGTYIAYSPNTGKFGLNIEDPGNEYDEQEITHHYGLFRHYIGGSLNYGGDIRNDIHVNSLDYCWGIFLLEIYEDACSSANFKSAEGEEYNNIYNYIRDDILQTDLEKFRPVDR